MPGSDCSVCRISLQTAEQDGIARVAQDKTAFAGQISAIGYIIRVAYLVAFRPSCYRQIGYKVKTLAVLWGLW